MTDRQHKRTERTSAGHEESNGKPRITQPKLPPDIDELPEGEEMFYRGGTATATPTAARSDAFALPRALTHAPKAQVGLFGFAISLIGAILVGASLWISLGGTIAAGAIGLLGGVGFLAASMIALYYGWLLGEHSDRAIELVAG